MSQYTTIAAKTQLPPSPDMRLAVDSRGTTRLRSIAKFTRSEPQALACSPPVASAFTETESTNFYICKRPVRTAPADPIMAVSLGAVAGSTGVTLFRVTQPESPLLVFGFAPSKFQSSISSQTDKISSLVFQQSPNSSKSLYLAAAKGASAFVWDASGQSLRPLKGRLQLDGATTVDSDTTIKSLAWKPESDWIAAVTSSSACLWDMREQSFSALFKPSLRFGLSQRSAIFSPNIQIAWSETYECAIMDAAGRLRVFDIRQTERGRTNSAALYSFRAFQHAGFGASYFPSEARNGNAWMTWGLDYQDDDATVRIWTADNAAKDQSALKTEDYWYMDGAPDPFRRLERLQEQENMAAHLLVQCTVPGLSCARTSLWAMKDSFLTVAAGESESREGWRADLWKVCRTEESQNHNLQHYLSFSGSQDMRSLGLPTSASDASPCAAELAISVGRSSSTSNEAMQSGLMLCCLGDSGYFTTHAVPEAVSKQYMRDGGNLPKFNSSLPMRIYPPHGDTSAVDALQLLGDRGVPTADSGGAPVGSEASREQAVSSMPFDMDAPVAYPVTGVAVASNSAGLTVEITDTDDHERAEDVARAAAAVMSRIEKDRIPCPRLCGASFSPGTGSLSLFSNGDVMKLWKWWEKDSRSRKDEYPQPTLTTKTSDELPPFQAAVVRNSPRTLQELVDMVAAAKEAQWGDQGELSTNSFDDFRFFAGRFFDDYASDESSESLDDDSAGTLDAPKDMYENYFSEAKRPLVAASLHPLPTASDDNIGPSSDLLSATVRVTRAFDKQALCDQSRAIADGWRLGTYLSQKVVEGVDTLLAAGKETDMTIHSAMTNKPSALPSYRFLVPVVDALASHQAAESMTRYDDPLQMLLKKPSKREAQHYRAVASKEDDQERGVHGGEYSVRPDMQESMVFLKKIFSQHQKDESSIPSRATMLSPPDSPMLPNSLLRSLVGPAKTKRTVSLPDVRSQPSRTRVGGIHVLRVADQDPSHLLSDALREISEVCSFNANVSESLGEMSKRDMWNLLAKSVDSRLKSHSTVTGDWERAGDALGMNLVKNVLSYYECLRDIQMLATMVCVLRHPIFEIYPSFRILPGGAEDHKYDLFLRKYANLLYSWSRCTIRAEVNKHLSRVFPSDRGDAWQPGLDKENQSIGITLAFQCPLCASEVVGDSYCHSCRNFGFRCVICDTAVRGLFTCCEMCGHGGHVRHLTAWFSTHGECPTGCGCQCIIRPVEQQSLPGPSSSEVLTVSVGEPC